MSYWTALFICIAANVSANASLKYAIGGVPLEFSKQTLFAVLRQPFLWVGFLMCGIVLLTYLYALRGIPMAIAYTTVAGTATIGMALVGVFMFNEILDIRAMFGIAFVLAGVSLLATS